MRTRLLLFFLAAAFPVLADNSYSPREVKAAVERMQLSGGRFFNDAYDFKTLDLETEYKGSNDAGDEYLYRLKTVTLAEAQECYNSLLEAMDPLFEGWKRNPVSKTEFTEVRWSTLEKVDRGRNEPYFELFKLNMTYQGEYATVGIVLITADAFAVPKVDNRENLTLQQFVEKAVTDAANAFAAFAADGDLPDNEADGRYRVGDFEVSHAWHPQGSEYYHLKLERQCTEGYLDSYYVYQSMVKSFLPGFEETVEESGSTPSTYYVKEPLKASDGSEFKLKVTIYVYQRDSKLWLSVLASRGPYSSPEQLAYQKQLAEQESIETPEEREVRELKNEIAWEERKAKILQQYIDDYKAFEAEMEQVYELHKDISEDYERYGEDAYVKPKQDKLDKLCWKNYEEIGRMMRVYENEVPEDAMTALEMYWSELRIYLELDDE